MCTIWYGILVGKQNSRHADTEGGKGRGAKPKYEGMERMCNKRLESEEQSNEGVGGTWVTGYKV